MKQFMIVLAVVLISGTLASAEIGDDGLHKASWMRETFKDLSEDLADANTEGKRFMVIIEQRGCIYCRKMHETVFSVPKVADYIEDNFFVLQINMFGNVEVTDFDGISLPEKDMVRRWGSLFTPTILFFPVTVSGDRSAAQAAVATMPGAFGLHTTYNMLTWIVQFGYDGDESLQKYHARKFAERG